MVVSIPAMREPTPGEESPEATRRRELHKEITERPQTIEERFFQWQLQKDVHIPNTPKDRSTFRLQLHDFLHQDVSPFIEYSKIAMHGLSHAVGPSRPPVRRVYLPRQQVDSQLGRQQPLFDTLDGTIEMTTINRTMLRYYGRLLSATDGYAITFPEIRGGQLLYDHFSTNGQLEAAAAARELLIAFAASADELNISRRPIATR